MIVLTLGKCSLHIGIIIITQDSLRFISPRQVGPVTVDLNFIFTCCINFQRVLNNFRPRLCAVLSFKGDRQHVFLNLFNLI